MPVLMMILHTNLSFPGCQFGGNVPPHEDAAHAEIATDGLRASVAFRNKTHEKHRRI